MVKGHLEKPQDTSRRQEKESSDTLRLTVFFWNNNQIHLLEKQDNKCKQTKPTNNVSYLHFYDLYNIDL